MDYKDNVNNLKDTLKSLLTDENTDIITKAVSQVDELTKIHEEDSNQITHLKDRIVDIVKNTSFKDVSQESTQNQKLVNEPKDIETALKENVANIIKNRK